MKLKHLITLLSIVVIAIAAGVFMRNRERSTWAGAETSAAGALILPALDVNAVSAILIQDAQARLTLEKSDGTWTVAEAGGYPADFQKIRALLMKVKEMKIAQSVPGAEKFQARLNLLEPTGETIASGVLLQFKHQSGAPPHSIILGKNHTAKGPSNAPFGGNWPDGRYVRVKETGLIGLVADTFSSVTTDKSRWVNREFFTVREKTLVTLSQDGQEVWRLAEKDGKLALTGDVPEGKELDATVINGVTDALTYGGFADVATGETADFTPAKTCRMVDADGIQYDLTFGEKENNQYPLRVDIAYTGPETRPPDPDESADAVENAAAAVADNVAAAKTKVAELNARLNGWTYLVNGYSLDPVNKTRDDFFKEQSAAAEPAPTAESR
ncbi:MAG: DUF4340 domain-containing protein [Lentisphaeria bacterium]|nr:DUF4340 domain-containing protein [Lentisphaeria bacterium]